MAGRSVGGGVSARALITLALSASLAAATSLSCAYAGGGTLPTSGQYVAGSGSIAKTGTTGLTINQSSNSGIINWKSFSIGNGNSVQFNNGSGATLNRVTGGDLSTIAGSLTGTGSVYLINPQGVIVTNTGKILTGGTFVGSTRDQSDDDFINGKRHFTGTSKGNVVNQGQIVSSNGDVALIGNAVTNNGTVSAKSGTASLNAGNDVLLAPAGSNGRIMISGGSGDASNSGTISAAQAQLNAAGGNVYALSGNNGGIVRATGTATIGGHVWLTSGSGNVSTAGTIAATNADGSGGAIEATGANITTAGAIDASATAAGQTGGHVRIVSTGTTKIGGTIAANGGTQGQGGFVETSGEQLHVADDAKITTLATDGIAGTWLIDPADFTIAASGGDITGATLSSELAGGDIVIQSSGGTVNTNGNGDIFVNDAVTWASGHTLTLDAARNIDIGATVSITGAGGLDLIYGDQAQNGTGNAANGDLDFGLTSVGFTGHVNYGATNNGGTLAINGTSYTLLYSMSDVQNINASGTALQGVYVLATSLDASSVSNWAPIGTDGTSRVWDGSGYSSLANGPGFSGIFEGLGNTISNLTVNNAKSHGSPFGYSSGAIRDIGMVAGSVIGVSNSNYLGGLVGYNSGNIDRAYASAAVSGGVSSGTMGGLVGGNSGTIVNAWASGSVTGASSSQVLGGLVGANDTGGTITNSYATGTVSGSYNWSGGLVGLNSTGATINNSWASASLSSDNNIVGGLVGENDGTISNAFYTGVVNVIGSAVGGLVGINNSGTISNSYSTGTITGGQSTGGLVGSNGGSVSDSYSAATVNGDDYVGGLVGGNNGTISGSYATGSIHGGSSVGGLVGANGYIVANAYATGSVTGSTDVGGLIGENDTYGSVSHAYSTGVVTGSGNLGGVAGLNNGTLANVYWDTDTSEQTIGIGLDNNNQSANVTGETTAQLTAALPTGWDKIVWGNVNNQTTPYLLALTSSPQTVYVGDGSEGPFSLLFNMAQVQAINANDTALQGNYALANSVDASAVTNWIPIGTDGQGNAGNSGKGFTGIFDGLGNTISNLTVDIGSNDYAGLFGFSDGTIRNIGVVGGSVSGGANVGGLVGLNDGYGTISDSYATDAVKGAGFLGGLVGESLGSITDVYATGAVTGDSASVGVGGLVGLNGAPINYAYATGTVTGHEYVGGLVGASSQGSIYESYATGAVNGVEYAGGLVGDDAYFSHIIDSYWDTDTSGLANGIGLDQSSQSANVTGKTTAQLTAGLPKNWDTYLWGNVNNQTTPYLLFLTSNLQTVFVGDGHEGALSLLFNMAQVQAINASGAALQGNYALANSVDASSANNWIPIGTDLAGDIGNSGNGFSGIFDGLGNTISNLTINITTGDDTGLFGYSTGTLRNVRLDNVTINASGSGPVPPVSIGSLAGFSGGMIENAWATGAVTANIETSSVGGLVGTNKPGTIIESWAAVTVSSVYPSDTSGGGLVGINFGTIENSYATGAVAGGQDGEVGGLAGGNGFGGVITQSYASGSVSGHGNSLDGGLVGFNVGIGADGATITDSYATGTVTGENYVGGLVGEDVRGNINNSYATGEVTTAGEYTVLVGGLVGLNSQSTISHSYWNVDTNLAATLGIGINDNSPSVDLTGEHTAQLQGSLPSGFSNTIWGTGPGLYPYLLWQYPTGTPQSVSGIAYNGTTPVSAVPVSLLIDGTALGSASTGANGYYYFLAAPGTISNSQVLTYLPGTGGAALGQNASGSITGLNISKGLLTTSTDLTTYSAFNTAFTGDLSTAVGSNSAVQTIMNNLGLGINATGNFAIDQSLNVGAHALSLISDGSITETGSGSITAGVLSGSSVSATALNAAANNVIFLSTFTSAGFALNDALSLQTLGAVNAGSGALSLTTTGTGHNLSIGSHLNSNNNVHLTSTGTITQNASGIITAPVLTGSSAGATTLTTAANNIFLLSTFTSVGFALNDAASLLTLGTVNAGNGALSLTTTGTGHNLSIWSPLTSTNNVHLTSAGTITQNASGIITAPVLTGSSVGATTLTTAANNISLLSTFTSVGFALNDAVSLLTLGAVNAGSGALSLTTTGTGHNLSIWSPLTSTNNVHLISASTITQNASGIITAPVLTGSSVGATTLTTAANNISLLSTFSSVGFALNDAASLLTLGTVNAGNGALSLTTTGTGRNLSIWSTLTTTGAVSLTSADTITEKNGSGAIDASSLSGSSVGGATLNGVNLVGSLGNFTNSGAGDFDFTDDEALTVGSAISVASSTGTLDLITTAGNLTVNGTLTGPTVTLNTAGEALESTSASITATTTLNVSAKTGINLNSTHNHIHAVGTRQTTSGPNTINGVGM